MQLAALIVGIVGMVLSYLAYFGTIFSNIAVVAATEHYGNVQGGSIASLVLVAVDALIAILCLVGLILGVVGLVKSIRRATRTVKGIVMSAIGLSLSEVGLVFMIIGMVLSGVFRLLINAGAFH